MIQPMRAAAAAADGVSWLRARCPTGHTALIACSALVSNPPSIAPSSARAPGTARRLPASATAATVPDCERASLSRSSNHVANRCQRDVAVSLTPSGQVQVHRYSSWIAVDISTDILFQSGIARLSPAAITALQRLAAVLETWPNAVRVVGPTDRRPIDTAGIPSNWELSAARAASVVHLFMDQGIAPERLAVLGFGEYRPVMPNTTLAGRNANRRVEIVILGRDAAPEAGLLAETATLLREPLVAAAELKRGSKRAISRYAKCCHECARCQDFEGPARRPRPWRACC